MIFDFNDKGKYLARHSRKRLRTYEAEPAYNVVKLSVEELRDWLV